MSKVYDGNVLMMVALVDTDVGDVVSFGATGVNAGGSIGVAQTAGLTGESISVDVVGVYNFPATTANVVTVGAILYWSGTELTTTATDNTKAGVAWSAKAGVAGSVNVKIG